ncbi:MAG: DUF4878 domain-containing protein [Actinomycetota bacterium]
MRAATGVFLALLLVICAAPGCGSGAPSRTPEEVTLEFLGTLKEGDYASAYDMLSAADREGMTEEQWRGHLAELLSGIDESVSYEITDEQTSEDEAAVGVEITQGGESQTLYIMLVPEGDDWKISLERSETMNN